MTLSTDLISYYKLDETSGTTAYDSVGSNNGTISNATYTASGKINGAYDFNGGANYKITFGSGVFASTGDTGSISAWVYIPSTISSRSVVMGETTTVGEMQIIIEGNNIDVIMYSGSWIFYFYGTGTVGTGWHHIVYTSSSSGNKCYLDGSSYAGTYTQGSASTPGFFGTLDPALIPIIGNNAASTLHFQGIIDEVGIWSRALTSTEITELYNSGNGLAYPFPSPVEDKSFFTLSLGNEF